MGSEDSPNAIEEHLSRSVTRRTALKTLAGTGLALGPGASLLGPLAGVASGATGAVAPQRGAWAVAFDPLDPAVSSNGVSINLFFYVYESLYRAEVGSPTTFVPELAVGAPVKINPTTYHVNIRPGAKFHNGDPVTADDVVFSAQRVKRFGEASFLGKYLVNFKQFRAVGTHTVEIKLAAPMALIEQRLATIRVLSHKAVRGANSGNVLKYQPIGSGPYRVASADPASGVKLVKFAGYNGPLKADFPANEIDFSIVTDPSAQLAGLQSNRFDAISQVVLSAVASIKSNGGLRVASPTGHAIHGFLFNAGSKPFNDYRVRQAVMYGIDRNQIAQAAYFGNASVANALVPTENADYTKPSTVYTRNVAKAKSLLAAAGYSNGLSYELMVGTNIAGALQTAQLVQQQLADVGIKVTLKPGDLGALYSNVTAGHYDSLYAPSSPAILGSADAEFIYRWLYYGAFATQYIFWKDPMEKHVENLLDKAVTSVSFPAYKKVMSQVINIVAEQGPFQPVVLVDNPVAWNPKSCAAITPSHVGNLYLGKNL